MFSDAKYQHQKGLRFIMALANAPTVISVEFTDKGGKAVEREYRVPISVFDPATGLLADIQTIRNNLVAALANISDALISKTTIKILEQEDTASVGTSDALVSQVASLVVNLDKTPAGQTAVITVPIPNDGIFISATGKDRDRVDAADAALNTFLDFFQTTGGKFTISDGDTVDDTTPLYTGVRLDKKGKR